MITKEDVIKKKEEIYNNFISIGIYPYEMYTLLLAYCLNRGYNLTFDEYIKINKYGKIIILNYNKK